MAKKEVYTEVVIKADMEIFMQNQKGQFWSFAIIKGPCFSKMYWLVLKAHDLNFSPKDIVPCHSSAMS